MELVYLLSPTRQQHDRALEVLEEVREAMPDVDYREVDPREDPDFAAQYHIKHSPGLIVDGRIEWVGIPRPRMILNRLRQLQSAGSETSDEEE